MRGVIKDILTNWRNVLGKNVAPVIDPYPPFTGFPYTCYVTEETYSTFNFTYMAGVVPMTFTEHYTIYNGTEYTIPQTTNTAHSPIGHGFGFDLLAGTPFTIDVLDGEMEHLTINGHVIF